jgi:hypothetical protein
MNGHTPAGPKPAKRRSLRRPIEIFAVACLVISVILEAATVVDGLGHRFARSFTANPYQLRLRSTDWFRIAVLAAHKTVIQAEPSTPILVDPRSDLDWALAYRLQPRRVFFDREAVRQRLIDAGSPYLVVHLDSNGSSANVWFEHFDSAGQRVSSSGRSLAVHADGFESGTDNWTDVVASMDD